MLDRGAFWKNRGAASAGKKFQADFSDTSLGLDPSDGENFSRDLKDRHIQLIGLGGAIGVGLFLGSAKAIQSAGPAIVISYAIAGAMIVIVVRALGEMLLYRPMAGSFVTYAEEFVGPWAGFMTGWSYWLNWVLVGIAEITAIGIYTRYWFPSVPQWIPALIALIVLYAMNMRAVKIFGEMEFWLSLIKVVTIIALIVVGVAITVFHIGDLSGTARFSNLWSYGGFMPKGYSSLLVTLPIAIFAFGGVELIGVAAGEAQNPRHSIPRAIDSVLYRIIIFYVGSLLVVMSLVPWTQLAPDVSPFVVAFKSIGIPVAGDIMNFVVITAAASSCNSGVFSTGRMLHSLAGANHAPSIFSKVSRARVPAIGISFSMSIMLIGVLMNYLIPSQLFGYVISLVLITQLWTWTMIVLSHMGYRKAVNAGEIAPSPYKLPLSPYTNWLALSYIGLVACIMCFDPHTQIVLYIAPFWFAALTIGYRYVRWANATCKKT